LNSQVHRNTSLEQVLALAKKEVDGICLVQFWPASAPEIAQHDADVPEEKRRSSIGAMNAALVFISSIGAYSLMLGLLASML
jgi:hypothetical protein